VPGGERLASLRTRPRLQTAGWRAQAHQGHDAWEWPTPGENSGSGTCCRVTSLLAVGLKLTTWARERPPGSLAVARYGWDRDLSPADIGWPPAVGFGAAGLSVKRPGVRWRVLRRIRHRCWTSLGRAGWSGWIGKNVQRDPRASGALVPDRPPCLHATLELPARCPAETASAAAASPLCIDCLPHRRHCETVRGGCPPLACLCTRSRTAMRACRRRSAPRWALGWPLRHLSGRLPLERTSL